MVEREAKFPAGVQATGSAQEQHRGITASEIVATARRAGLNLAVFLWLWFWRSNSFTGGDSEQWARMIDAGFWFQETQPLVFFIVQCVFRLIHAAFGGTASMAFALVSCFSGVLAFNIITRLYETSDSRLVRWLLVLTSGFTILFYGHVESYALPAAVLMFHLLCIKRSSEGRWPVYLIPLSYAFMVALHLVALFIFPAVVYVTARETWRRTPDPQSIVLNALMIGGAVATWLLVRQMGVDRSGDSLGYLKWFFATLLNAELPHTARPGLKLLFAFWNGGVASILLVQAWPMRRERLVQYWTPYLLFYVGFSFVWSAYRGEADFDLHTFPWIVASLLAAWVYRPVAWARLAVVLIIGLNLFLWLSRTAAFADLGNRGTATLEVCPEILQADGIVLLDDRQRLRPLNRFILQGKHRIRLYMDRKVLQTELELRRREAYRICVRENAGIFVEAIPSSS